MQVEGTKSAVDRYLFLEQSWWRFGRRLAGLHRKARPCRDRAKKMAIGDVKEWAMIDAIKSMRLGRFLLFAPRRRRELQGMSR